MANSNGNFITILDQNTVSEESILGIFIIKRYFALFALLIRCHRTSHR